MGKKSGITKAGRNMNPADRERKQQRAKELKRNKKQRVQVRHAIVKSRNPDEIIEALSRLDDQEFEPGRQLSLNVIQEKRNKLKGSYYQIIGLCRQEKDERKVKNLERMMFEYEVERARKEENYRAQQFSQEANFDEIPLPSGISIPEAASTPYSSNSGAIGPQIPGQMQAAMKAGILKKTTTAKKQHKHPPGPPPGLPPSLTDSEEEEDEEGSGWPDERRKRVRFGEPPSRRARDDFQEEDEDEDYAPVEIPDGMFGSDQPPPQQQPIYSRPVPSLAAPAIGPGPIMPGMAPPPPAHPQYPTGYSMHSSDRMRGSQVQAVQQATIGYPPDPHSSAIISAGPQVVKPSVEEPQSSASGETVISAAPQMRNIKREATRFVPTAVKIGKPVVPTVIGPKIPTSSVAGPTKLLPRSQTKSKPKPTGQSAAGGGMKSVDEACDEFLKELDGLL